MSHMSKTKKIILIALGILFALNIAATLIGNQIKEVKSEVVAVKDAAKLFASETGPNNLRAEITKLSAEVAALRQKNDQLEELVQSLVKSEHERLKEDIGRLSAYAENLGKKLK